MKLLRRLLLLVVAVTLVAVALAPSLVQWIPPLRETLTRRLVGNVNGDVVVESVSAGWFQPIELRGVRVVDRSGERLLDVERIESDRVLWRIAASPADMGTIRIERPTVNLVIRADGNNFKDVFSSVKRAPRPPGGLKFGAKAQIVDGRFECRSHESAPWSVAGINLGVGVRPASRSESGKAELLVDHGTLLDNVPLSVGLCNDVLSYAAPTLKRVANVSGAVTIELDDWRLPWDDLAAGELSGRLTMHTVQAAPGPMVRQVYGLIAALPLLGSPADAQQLPQPMEIAHDSQIPFRLVERKIHHAGLRCGLFGAINLETEGYVGADRSLDLTATVSLAPSNPDQRATALMRVLPTQGWPIHIRGTLSEPIIDAREGLKAAGFELGEKIAADIEAGNPSVGAAILEKANEAGLPIAAEDLRKVFQLLKPTTAAKPVLPNEPPSALIPSVELPPPQGPSIAAPPVIVPPVGAPPFPGDPGLPGAAPVPSGVEPESQTGAKVIEGVGAALDLLQSIRARREEKARAEQNPVQIAPPPGGANPGAPPPPPAAPAPTARRPLLRQGLRMLIDGAGEAIGASKDPVAPPGASLPPPGSSLAPDVSLPPPGASLAPPAVSLPPPGAPLPPPQATPSATAKPSAAAREF